MIDALASFHFLRPAWLLLLLPALGIWYFQGRLSDVGEQWRSVFDPELLQFLLEGNDARSLVTPRNMLLSAWLLCVIAVAGPAWEREPSPFADAKPAVMVVLRVTPSMQTADLAPTRLDRARQKLSDLFKLREGASTGLVAYAGSPHLVLPPTADTDVVVAMAQALSPEIMPKEGDDLSSALALAQSVLAGNGQGGSILRRGRCGGRGTGRALEGASRSGHLPCRPSIRRSAPGACGCRFGAECPRRRDDDRSVRH